MTVSNLLRSVGGIVLAAATLALPSALAAQAPSPQELARVSASGNYLAARHASSERDAASASAYYRAALRADPRNPDLLERAFLSVVADGEIDEGVRLAERILQQDKSDRMARLVLGVRALKQKQYQTARTHLAQSVRGPITDLAATLLSAWASYGAGDPRGAAETIDKLTGADWYAIFKDLHSGMILDLANRKDAGKRLERAYKLDQTALRVVEAYASWASRHLGKDEALKVLETFNKALPNHPLVAAGIASLKRGETIPPLVDTAQAGAAEVLYGLGASIGRRGGEDFGLIYLQLSLYLAPQKGLSLLSLADLYEAMKKPQLAIKVYERVPEQSPLRRNAEIHLATNLDSVDRTEEAKAKLHKLIADRSDDLEAIMALGNIERARKQFAECAETYSKGIATIANPERANWLIFYFRGICYERSKKWSNAEADLKRALELYPDQPHVLNYLGYSWIDQGVNLDEGMRMIRRAVEQRPDDGYIVDSLGWAYYRLGNYEEATKNLERAVELKPDDPTINDHLGDAYFRSGRLLEAKFQWSHARDLKPEPEELAKIEEKLRTGMIEDTPTSAANAVKKKVGNGG